MYCVAEFARIRTIVGVLPNSCEFGYGRCDLVNIKQKTLKPPRGLRVLLYSSIYLREP
jgi:hypothetical protein